MKIKSELIFIIDKSGSMSGLEKDTIGGFNSLIKKQIKEEGETIVSLVLFDDVIHNVYNRVSIKEVKTLTEKDYVASGCTALLDAIGTTINKISNKYELLEETEKADKVLCIITTDGLENASEEFTYNNIKKLINKKKESNWEFIFLGANIDSVEVADSIGINKEYAVDYKCDKQGIEINYECLNDAINSVRQCGSIRKEWRKKIDKDVMERGK